MPTQLNGRVADMDKILGIAEEYGLQIYEDSAQALGAKYKDQCAGSFGLGGCISLYPAKTLGCFGDVEDIANLVVFIASSRAKFVNGANFVVDGGQSRS